MAKNLSVVKIKNLFMHIRGFQNNVPAHLFHSSDNFGVTPLTSCVVVGWFKGCPQSKWGSKN